jgi:predicted RNA binding protein YcfA (HicA-like mRNA interferase family)
MADDAKKHVILNKPSAEITKGTLKRIGRVILNKPSAEITKDTLKRIGRSWNYRFRTIANNGRRKA